MIKFLAIMVAVLASSSALANESESAHKGADHSKMGNMHKGMMQGEHQGHGNQVDAHFLDRFMKHHQDGIEMAKFAQQKAHAPEIKKMASKISKDQPKEIAQMQKWRKEHFSSVAKANDMPPSMDMSKLRSATGAEFDIVFADMMAKHHDDGIKMVESVEGQLKNPEVKRFAEQSRKNQMMERDQLAQLKSSFQSSMSGTTSAE